LPARAGVAVGGRGVDGGRWVGSGRQIGYDE